MGGTQSTLSGGEGYSQRAAAAKKFADSILTLFFSKANLKRLLDLHKLDQCSKFVFTTAQDLQSQFQKIQISPALGKKGEILFAPIQDIAPGLLKQNATNAESMRLYAELTHARNENCIHVAYFYVRVFQIYSALALTVINADPTRRRAGIALQGVQGAQGPQRAALLGGYRQQGGLYRQGGGAIPQSGPFKPLRDSIKATPLQVILGYLEPVGAFNNTRQTLRLSDKRQGVKGSLYLTWEYPSPSQEADVNLEAKYLRTGNSSESVGRLNAKKDGANVIITIEGPNGSFSQTFSLGIDQVWGFKYDAGEGKRDDPVPFYDEIHAVFAEDDGQGTGAVGQGAVGQASGTSAQGSSGQGISGQGTSSATAFEGFEKLKKLFEDTSSGAKEFPKAYCIARAMTLLNPIFPNELPDRNQPYYSQVCKKVYDFESGEPLMPRVGTSAKVNVYLRSLVSLYYDDYKYDKTKKTIKLTQTESGRSELQNLSKEFAALYMMPTVGAETFLAADDDRPSASTMTQFREIGFCAKRDGLIRIEQDQKGKEFLNTLQSQVIQPMLAFQEQHTQKVNALLMKMFKVETITPPGGRPEVNLRLTDAVKSRGTEGINTIGKEAHRLLREYYRKSEAFYMKGVLMFEKNPGGWKI
jgi:hypothetical protein